MEKLMHAVMMPVVLVSWLAGPVGAIWLVLSGEWWAVGYALLSVFVSHVLLGIALMPALLLAAPALVAEKRNLRLSIALGILPLMYVAALATVWCMGVLTFFMTRSTDSTWIPLALLAFSVGTGPWGYMAQKESQAGGGEGSAIATFFINTAFVVVLAMLFLDRYRPVSDFWVAFAVVMAIEVAFSIWLANEARTA